MPTKKYSADGQIKATEVSWQILEAEATVKIATPSMTTINKSNNFFIMTVDALFCEKVSKIFKILCKQPYYS